MMQQGVQIVIMRAAKYNMYVVYIYIVCINYSYCYQHRLLVIRACINL
jgi:hypothetical protein